MQVDLGKRLRPLVNFRILHITDIHFGQSAMMGSWPSLRANFLSDLLYLSDNAGPIDVIVLTGDIANRGETGEYDRAEELIKELAARLEDRAGVRPQFICVPGNHDVQRNMLNKVEKKVLEAGWDEDIQNGIFTDTTDPVRLAVYNAFATYRSWVEKAPCTMVDLQNDGTLPGDFTATFEKDGVRLGFLGLNSSFRHVSDWAKEGSLSIPSLQIHAAAGGDLPYWCESIDLGVLLTHHPTSWLANEQDFNDTVFFENSPIRIHLCGHLHEPKHGIKEIATVQESFFLQGESLFGCEFYPNGKVRLHGYAVLDVETTDADWSVKIYPRTAGKLAGGPWRFDRSNRFGLQKGKDASKAIDLSWDDNADRPAAILVAEARRYDRFVQDSRHSSDDRTAQTNAIIDRIKSLSDAAKPADAAKHASSFLASDSPGYRIVGLAIVQGAGSILMRQAESSEIFKKVLRIYVTARSALEEIQALEALRALAPRLKKDQEDAARAQIEAKGEDHESRYPGESGPIPALIHQVLHDFDAVWLFKQPSS